MEEALGTSSIDIDLSVVKNGREAIDYIRHRGGYAMAPRPDIVFLDLNLPVMDGREVLADIKRDPDLRRIPVIVLTTSIADRDIQDAYEGRANCYVTKPMEFDRFLQAIHCCEEFWLGTARLPQ